LWRLSAAALHGPIALFFLTYAAMYQCRGHGL
jgi:hypothetical protein